MLPGCVPWPDEFARRYRQEGYWQGVTLGEVLGECADRYGDRIAVVAGERRWTYRELDRHASALAAGLERLGVQAGDRVVVQLPNLPELIALCFALFRLGAPPVLALPAHRRNEIQHLCEVSGAVAYVVPDVHQGFDYRPLAAQLRESVPSLRHVLVVGEAGEHQSLAGIAVPAGRTDRADPGDVALLLLSGGTTGLPKLIPRTHDDYALNMRASAAAVQLGEHDVYLVSLPIAHNAALGCPGVLGTLHAGGKVVLTDSMSPDDAFPLIENERVTMTTGVPTLAILWLEEAAFGEFDLSSLRLLQIGGAKFSPSVAERVRPELGCLLTHWFGMGEGPLAHTALHDDDETVAGTVGRALFAADEFRIVDNAGDEVGEGETGELIWRGPCTIRGYYRAEEANATAFTAAGFFRTGDLARRTSAGHLCIEGRAKEVINRGGDKVPVEEVESHIVAHPGIREVAVVAMPDAILGERSCAFVITEADAVTTHDLNGFLRERGVAAFKLPDRVEVVDALPRTGIGKIDRAALRRETGAR